MVFVFQAVTRRVQSYFGELRVISMEKRATLRDIARAAGVSAVTVHKAIYGKSGVSGETRERILEIASRMDYSVNIAASSLKRNAVHIAVVLQSLSNPENFFFRKMWDGIAKAEQELHDYRVRISRFECEDNWRTQEARLVEIGQRNDINGVIMHPSDETKLNAAIEFLWNKNIPVVTANSDASASKRVANISARNDRIGALAAELLAKLMNGGGRVVVAGGNKTAENLRANRRGFRSCLKEIKPGVRVTDVFNFSDSPRFRNDIAKALADYPDIEGIYAATSRDTYIICQILDEAGLSGKIKLVGSDAFEEMLPFFSGGTLDATICKDQESQAKQAVLQLYNYLTGRSVSYEPIKVSIVMRNNIDDYL